MVFQLMTLPQVKDTQEGARRLRMLFGHAREVIRREPKVMVELLEVVDQILNLLEQIPSNTKTGGFNFSDLVVSAAANA